MNDADAAEARTTDPSRSTIDGRSVPPPVVTPEEWQKARDAPRSVRVDLGNRRGVAELDGAGLLVVVERGE